MGGAWYLPGRTGVEACVRRCCVSRKAIPQHHWTAATNEQAPGGGWLRQSKGEPSSAVRSSRGTQGANPQPAGNPERWLLFGSHAFPSYIGKRATSSLRCSSLSVHPLSLQTARLSWISIHFRVKATPPIPVAVLLCLSLVPLLIHIHWRLPCNTSEKEKKKS